MSRSSLAAGRLRHSSRRARGVGRRCRCVPEAGGRARCGRTAASPGVATLAYVWGGMSAFVQTPSAVCLRLAAQQRRTARPLFFCLSGRQKFRRSLGLFKSRAAPSYPPSRLPFCFPRGPVGGIIRIIRPRMVPRNPDSPYGRLPTSSAEARRLAV